MIWMAYIGWDVTVTSHVPYICAGASAPRWWLVYEAALLSSLQVRPDP